MSSADPSLLSEPFADASVPLLHQIYLHTAGSGSDPTMVWGTEVDMTNLQEYLADRNRNGSFLLTTTPILIRAVGLALTEHPEVNRRVLGRRLYAFRHSNVLVPLQRRRQGVALSLVSQVEQKSYAEIALSVWEAQRQAAQGHMRVRVAEGFYSRLPLRLKGWFIRTLLWSANHLRKRSGPLDENLRGAPVLVNHFGFPGAPPLTSYKPSRFATDCTLHNVTLGPTNLRAVVTPEGIVSRPVSSLFVRGDHRVMNAAALSAFVNTLVRILEHPAEYDRVEEGPAVEVQQVDPAADPATVASR